MLETATASRLAARGSGRPLPAEPAGHERKPLPPVLGTLAKLGLVRFWKVR